ncbi:GGDEF domain-containing protein [Gymnodinialimonas ceratoperidinii]|uniref:Diguanylate cyclase n=1 Tax=Gymnodinialimonas ceratoperidinii TaxID=2856823 RepID=A0A8F6TZP4_9RHOB|nr:diguanylate cyclase [Gymnodinialimonas ceratoperidinii]QXT40964.1 diguanylate cyclase [Gymnodinialimonas ceratoperidinii]
MNVAAPPPAISLSHEVLDSLMPMHIVLDGAGQIRHVGPTMAKLLGDTSATGQALLDVFDLRRPADVFDFAGLRKRAGQRLSLSPRSADHLSLRAVIMPLAEEDGMILDVSLGLSFARAVADHALTLHDFSPCDQTTELLYLHEANSSTSRLSRHLSERLQAAHAAAEQQARTDVLTGLSNRRAMDDELEHLLNSRSQDFCLLHLDLDLFKHVNDTYGHAAGDAVLVEVGRILTQELRGSDLPARVGGDEFLVLLRPAVSNEIAGRIATRLIERIERPIRIEEHLCQVSASIGVVSTCHYDRRPSIEKVLADVDGALYQAKNAGRGRFVISNLGGRVPGDEPPRAP